MIARIDMMLCHWGRWALAGIRKSVGYSSICPMFKSAGNGAYGSGIPAGVFVGDFDIRALDSAVLALPEIHRIVVKVHYQNGKSMRDTAAKCGIKRGMLIRYLDESHRAIDRWLSDSQNVS